jgi:transketolase
MPRPNEFAHEVRRLVLEQSKRAGVGHIGSALAIADLVALLYSRLLRDSDPDDPDRDRVVLSKGHAALALYAGLHLVGHVSAAELDTYCADDSLLGVHPERALKGVDFCTGSLGQGLSMAAGAALAARMQRSKRRVFAILSDAECNEGSVWEAAMFAAHHGLSNLVAIVDVDGQQAFGHTREVLDLDLPAIWRSHGWDVHEVDGHDVDLMQSTVERLDLAAGPPHVLLAHTTFGHGVSYMEGQIKWHYWPMNDQEYATALAEIEELRR